MAMQIHTLQDGADSFKVSVQPGAKSASTVLFAAGAGGQPERYATLLSALANTGCTVIAPHFERLTTPEPSETELSMRGRRLSLALDTLAPLGTSAMGVGHSIGAATLVTLAGAQMWLRSGQPVNMVRNSRLTRLALLATPTGFFQAPGAIESFNIPILAWVGSQDHVTPPAQTEWLADAMKARQTVDLRVTEGAGHFSFMDLLPPQAMEPLPDKQAFLREFSSEVCNFLLQ